MKTSLRVFYIFFIIASIIAITDALAQADKGVIVLSGAFGFSKTTQDYTTQTYELESNSLSIRPDIGFFLNNGWMIGLSVDYNRQWSEHYTLQYVYPPDVSAIIRFESKSSTWKFGPILRKYILVSEKFYVIAGLQTYLERGSGMDEVSSPFETMRQEFDIEGFGATLAPGLAYFISNRFVIQANFGSLSYTNRNNGTFDYQDFGFNFGSETLSFGFQYLIR